MASKRKEGATVASPMMVTEPRRVEALILSTRQLLAAINPLLGYPVLQIVSPLEV
jgi:hypothetical protein